LLRKPYSPKLHRYIAVESVLKLNSEVAKSAVSSNRYAGLKEFDMAEDGYFVILTPICDSGFAEFSFYRLILR
jgi:hypothetical protein